MPNTTRSGEPGRPAYYRPKAKRGQTVLLTDLGHRILRGAIRRTKRSKSDIFERLLREHGAEIADFPELEDEQTVNG
jgi:hypothetical protein